MLEEQELMNIPLFKQLRNDPNVRIVTRSIDCEWYYKKYVSHNISGFNPFENSIYISKNSAIARWIGNDFKSFRKFNFRDQLMSEFLFLFHDYLHIWAYQWISKLAPSVGFGKRAVNAKNFEDFVFCHLITEAVATVGLDYWYLSTFDFSKTIGLGTTVRHLTVDYHTKYDEEFKRFNPEFNSQRPEFFSFIAKFYCSGVFNGFDKKTVLQSPAALMWLDHEISYSNLQRIYSREWINTLSDSGKKLSEKELESPVDCRQKWKVDLIRNLGQLLWEKVRGGIPHYSNSIIRYPYPKKPKFLNSRMMNLNRINLGANTHYDMHFNQLISRYPYSDFNDEELEILNLIKASGKIKLLTEFLKKKKPMSASPKEPAYLFMLP